MEKYYLGKYEGIDIFTNIDSKDDKQSIELKNLPIRVKNEIQKLKLQTKSNPMNKWLYQNEYIIDRDEYHRLINLNDSILQNRSIPNREYLHYFLHCYTIDEMKGICRDFNIKGYSGLTKKKLAEFIKDSLSDEEIIEFLEEHEVERISRDFAIALAILRDKYKEKIISLKIVNMDEHEIEIHFTALNKWDTMSGITINSENIENCERYCDCVFGRDGGFCVHFWVGFIKSFKVGFFKVADWKLTALPYNFENKIKDINY